MAGTFGLRAYLFDGTNRQAPTETTDIVEAAPDPAPAPANTSEEQVAEAGPAGGGFSNLLALLGGRQEMVSLTSGPAAADDPLMSDQGPTLDSPYVITDAGVPVDIGQIATGIALADGDMALGQLIPFDRNAQCRVRPPQPGENVMNVRIETALQTAPLQAFSQAQLTARLIQNIEHVTHDGRAYDPAAQVSGQKTVMDVFVTDTSAPVYLVLQNLGPGIIWNIQPAPGVRIAHVVIVASDFSGLNRPSPDTTFEALLVRDFVSGHEFGADDEIRDCMIRPWRLPQPDWTGQIKADDNNLLYQNQMHSYRQGHIAYNAWYTQSFGVDARTNLATARDAAHALLGPVPPAPLTYRPLAGQDIHFMRMTT